MKEIIRVQKPIVKQNILDKIITYFNPVKGRDRLRSRMQMAAVTGGYTGASKSRRSLKEWITRGNDADSDILPDLDTLVERSRDLSRNAPVAGGAISTVCTNVVGTGLKLQAAIDRDFLNLSEDQADAWEATTEREFKLFAESQECDIRRTQNFYSLQELVFRSSLESGDVFVLLPHIEREGSVYNLKLQVIEADRISNPNNAIDSMTIAGGVEKDKFGAPTFYHIQKAHPGNSISFKREWDKIPAFGSKTGRRNVIHLYTMERPGQSRGIPYLAPVIEPLKQLERYTDAELQAAVISSMFTVFVKTETGDLDLLETSEVGAGVTSNDDYKLAPGAIVGLADGEDITTADPNRPNTAFDPFVQAILRQIGVRLELPFEMLIKHYTASYSASRAAMLEAWKFFRKRRVWLSQNFCDLVYSAFMDEAVSTGRISAPGFFDNPLIRKAYLGAMWHGTAQGQIDPLKEIKAAKERVDLGVSNLSRETIELSGEDWEKIHKQSVKEKRVRLLDGLETEEAQTMTTIPEQIENNDLNDQQEQ
tara:strand:+ start:2065 stop:3672 length:1608 start_codon:yes stop_codon:yes gene_type:complete